ncbi:MAG: GSCFA domain-containing protein [Chitinophagales bacterium]|jgi:hypothetical protein
MSVFRTLINIPAPSFQIHHQHQLLLVGSCFTKHIGTYLNRCQFSVLVNPYGICYNPFSIASAAKAQPLNEFDFFENEGIWRHWDLHSEFAHQDLNSAKATAHQLHQNASRFLNKTDVLILTLGTAEVFHLANQNRIVANCHKMPAKHFDRKRLSVSETTDILRSSFQELREKRPNLNIILTVSPVRHLRMGAIENQRSKSVLLLACEELSNSLPNTYYFPAYELIMDDLRDYRFYEKDLIHPSDLAVEYVQTCFAQTFFQKETIALITQIEKIRQALEHRPFNPNTSQHLAFLEKVQTKISALEADYPEIQFNWG